MVAGVTKTIQHIQNLLDSSATKEKIEDLFLKVERDVVAFRNDSLSCRVELLCEDIEKRFGAIARERLPPPPPPPAAPPPEERAEPIGFAPRGEFLTERPGSQIAKPVRCFSHESNALFSVLERRSASLSTDEARLIKQQLMKWSLLSLGFSGWAPVLGDGDCLFRSVYLALLSQGKIEPLRAAMRQVATSGVRLRGNSFAEGGSIPPNTNLYETVRRLDRSLNDLARGRIEPRRVLGGPSSQFDTDMVDVLRAACALEMHESLSPEVLGARQVNTLVRHARTRKSNCGPAHVGALSRCLGVGISTVYMNREDVVVPLERCGLDGAGICRIERSGEGCDVVLSFTGGGEHGHYNFLVNTRRGPGMDILDVFEDVVACNGLLSDRDDDEAVRIFSRLYALLSHIRDGRVLVLRRVVDSLALQYESMSRTPLILRRSVVGESSIPSGGFIMLSFPEGDPPEPPDVMFSPGEKALWRFGAEPSFSMYLQLIVYLFNSMRYEPIGFDVFAAYNDDVGSEALSTETSPDERIDAEAALRAVAVVLARYANEEEESLHKAIASRFVENLRSYVDVPVDDESLIYMNLCRPEVFGRAFPERSIT